jgi:hypothetical protein
MLYICTVGLSIISGVSFGMFQNNVFAGIFMFTFVFLTSGVSNNVLRE